MIRYILTCLILILSASIAFAQSDRNINIFIDKSFELIESNAINTDDLENIKDWLYTKSESAVSLDEIAPLYKEVFKRLNDHHGNLQYKGKSYGWNKPLNSENPYVKSRLKSEKIVVSDVLNGSYGYIRIPGNTDYAFKKVDSIASDIVSHVNSISSSRIKGWIVDLRWNTGGNMYPIILGLKDFIGDNIIFGGFQNHKGESTGKWEVANGSMLIDGVELPHIPSINKPKLQETPLVILTSTYTASAGEMTAISLIGRSKTWVVGEATADYTTAVQGFKINTYTDINLSTDNVVDRNRKVYKSSIVPDIEVIGGDDLDDMLNDKKISRALTILDEQSIPLQ